ncbi:hypothetical protein LTR72_012075, partial [Exophiala xenobiotica]
LVEGNRNRLMLCAASISYHQESDYVQSTAQDLSDAEDEDEDDLGKVRSAVVSEYFVQPGQAGMAKRNIADDTIAARSYCGVPNLCWSNSVPLDGGGLV